MVLDLNAQLTTQSPTAGQVTLLQLLKNFPAVT